MTNISTDLAVSMLQTAADYPEREGDTTPSVSIFSGPLPNSIADPVDVEDNVHLASFEFEDGMFGPAALVEGETRVEAVAPDMTAVEAVGAGEATFYRAYDANGAAFLQGEVSDDPESASDMIINQVNITLGAEVRIERFVIGVDVG